MSAIRLTAASRLRRRLVASATFRSFVIEVGIADPSGSIDSQNAVGSLWPAWTRIAV